MVQTAAAAAAANTPALVADFDRATKMYQPGEMVGGTISLKNSSTQMQYENVEISRYQITLIAFLP